MNFSKNLGDATRRRLFPNTNLRIEQLAHAIGCHSETLKNGIYGRHNMSSPLVAALIDYFTRCGDHSFICEIYPNAVEPLIQRNKRAEKAIAFAESFQAFVQQGAAA